MYIIMPRYNYIPIDYFSYNMPDYYAAVFTLVLFGIFFIILYLIFKYETYERQEICDPMFYYGKSCGKIRSKQILFSPKFMERKKEYYDSVAKYNKNTGKYEGVRERTAVDKQEVDNAEANIQDNLDSNTAFGKTSVDEIQKMSTISQLIASKYLGNLKSLLENAPSEIVDGLRELPQQLGELKQQIQESIVTPAFASYTAPLQKLYKSLTEIDKTTAAQMYSAPAA